MNGFAPNGSGDATSYTGVLFPSGAALTTFAPAIASNAYGDYTTGIGLLSLASNRSTVTITYQGIYSGNSASATDANLPAGFAGTATIQSSAGPVAAIVNEAGPGGQFSSYDAVPAGSTTLFAPAALNNAYGGYFTGMAIQNTSGTAGTLTVTYCDSAGNPTARNLNLAANGYQAVYQGSSSDGPAPGAYTARITSTVPIAGIVNEVAPAGAGPARQSTAYNTFPAGASALNLPLVENAGSDGWSTGEGIMNTRGLANGARATAVFTTRAGGQVAVICNESNATTFMSHSGQ